MRLLLPYPAARLRRFLLSITILCSANMAAQAQCYEDFYVYQSYPYGQLCSPQYVTLRAEYYNYSGNYVYGEFRWYSSDTDPWPVQTNTMYIDPYTYSAYAEYSVYANTGVTVWVSFYNYNTGCESYRTPYSFYFSPIPYLWQDYAVKCGWDVAKVQLSSNTPGVTFQLYKLYEYYDPWYGYVQDYQFVNSNTTGYFEIWDFDPATDAEKYYAKVYQPYGCSANYYYQLYFEVTSGSPPTISGNTNVIAGSSTTLTAGGSASNFKWYDGNDNFLADGWQYYTPTTLTPGTYTYYVRGTDWTGTCLSDPASVTVTVSLPPVNYTSLYTSSNFTKTIDVSKPVGTVNASAAIASGSATYTIPVYTPPGTNGLKPQINITYNSQADNGVVGYGWSIAGLPVISRTGRNLFYNGLVSPVSYTSTDAFMLDGVRLNPISGSNGGNGTIYAGDAESFSRITSYTSGSANNPDWFKVTTKDGTVMEFGNTSDARILTDYNNNVMFWRLNKIIDINGNYITFKYENAFRESRIDEISYTGNSNTGLQPYNKIKFSYGQRSDIITSYDGGASTVLKHLLTGITVQHDAATVKTYQFNYGFDNVKSMLKEVVESGSDGASLNSTIFLYGDQPQNLSVSTTTALQGAFDFFSGDFNGDGKTDLLAANLYYDQGVKYHSQYEIFSDITSSSSTVLYINSLPAGNSVNMGEKRFSNFLTSDYSGDGRDDILQINTGYGYTYPGSWKRLVNDVTINYTGSHNGSTGWTDYTPTTYPIPYAWGQPFNYIHHKGNFFIPGDFDGDGNQDYILILALKTTEYDPDPTDYFGFKAFLTCPSTSEINNEILNFGIGSYPPDFYANTIADADMITPFDFDGDGKHEILVTKGNTSYVLSVQRISATTGYSFGAFVIATTTEVVMNCRVYPGDFNGDRKSDLLVRNTNGSWKILYSTGTAFIAASFSFNQNPNITGVYSDDKMIVSDFNGDGKSDIVHGYGVSGGSRFSLYYSKGGVTGSSAFLYEQYVYNNVLSFGEFTVGDFNGDGRSDLLNRFHVQSPADFIGFKQNGKENLLVKATDGHNITNTFEYKLLTDKTTWPWFYNRTISLDNPANMHPFNYIELPVYAVSSFITPNGIGGYTTSSYRYEDGVVHRTAKGFLGFKKTTEVNATTGITTITENEINTQFAVPYLKKQRAQLTATGALLAESTSDVSHVSLSTGYLDPRRYVEHTDKLLQADYLSGAAIETVNTYDNYGNITVATVKKGALSGSTVTPTETITTTTTYGTYNTPVDARPTNIVVAATRTGMPTLSHTTEITYTGAGQVATRKEFAGLPQAITSTYAYNSFGNVTGLTLSAAGMNNRVTTSTYDARGILPLTSQRTGSGTTQTESFTYDFKWGQPLTKTSTDCLTNTFEYDGFGRIKKNTVPAGYAINTSLVWDVQGEKVYYIFTDHPAGTADVKVWYDKLGREVQKQIAGFNNQWLTQVTTYNAKGSVATKTNNYYPSETPFTTTTLYDAYNRPETVTTPHNSTLFTYTTLGGGKIQVTATSSGQTTSKTTDATSKVVAASDNGGQLEFTYDSRGNQVQVKHGSIIVSDITYDSYGRKLTSTDKNAGTVTYQHDAFGQVVQQTDNLGNAYNMAYDDLGRIITRQGPEGTTLYEYYKDISTGCSNNNFSRVTDFNGIVKDYTYDNLKRLQTETTNIDAVPHTTQYEYNTHGKLTKITYPSGVVVNNTYDGNGMLTGVSGGNAGAPVTLFTGTSMNGFGQYTGYSLGNGYTSQNTYTHGVPQRYYTNGIQDLNMVFDLAKGNLTSRQDAIKNITETFGYDALNRLTQTTVNNVPQINTGFDGNSSFSMGNIVTKTDAGNYVYKNDKIHAVAYITNPAGATAPPITTSVNMQQVTYTPFLRTATVTEDIYELGYSYGADYQRLKSILKQSGNIIERKDYLGNYEKQFINGVNREIHYVSGGNGMCAIIVREGGVNSFYFVYGDHLGSVLTVTDIGGNVVAEQNFDAWGRNRNPANWQYGTVPAVPSWLYRGYTGHEHLRQFALINMNGRLYDPVQGRMLSPDNYVQEPFNTQNYNRYTYCLNNPLRYNDPSGDFFLGTIITAIYDFFRVGFTKGGFEFWNWGSSNFRSAWREFDPTRSGSRTNNAFRIDMGVFRADPHRTFFGQILQVFSRLTWEAPQVVLGNLYSHVRNGFGGSITDVTYWGGATLVNRNNGNPRDRWGVTLGSYINSRNLVADPYTDQMFRHEYGHTLQSRIIGPMYLIHVGVPSFIGSLIQNEAGHSREWYETHANRLSLRYLQRHEPNALVFDPTTGRGQPWDFNEDPTEYNPNWYWFFAPPPPQYLWFLFF
jgi:RHS repeat-associated protein